MIRAVRQWVDLGEHVTDACANIVRNSGRPVARYLDRAEPRRLATKLDAHQGADPWPVAAIRPIMLTGANLSKVLGLTWNAIDLPGDDCEACPPTQCAFGRSSGEGGSVIAAAMENGPDAPKASSGVRTCAAELALGRLHPKPERRVIARRQT